MSAAEAVAKKNWGRWGAEDRLGALNLLAADGAAAAAGLVSEGTAISLGVPLRPGSRLPGRRTPTTTHRFVLAEAEGAPGWVDDYVFASTHGATHIDALCHCFYDDRGYNGVDGDSLEQLDITGVGPIVTRGVLIDVLAGRGGEELALGEEIGAAELQSACAAAGVELAPGDAVLIRTGWIDNWSEDERRFLRGEPGIGIEAARWLEEAGAVLVGADNGAVEAFGARPEQDSLPVHRYLLRDCGVYLLEMLELGSLAGALAAASRATFLLVAAPLQLAGASGGLVNPVAVL